MSGLLVFLDGNYKLIRDVVINSTKVNILLRMSRNNTMEKDSV